MSNILPESRVYTLYEFPLNERFRTYLRLEALYARWVFLLAQKSEHDHHSALMTLFETYEFAFRYDLKGDILTEINRYKQALGRLRHLPELSEEKLTETLLLLTDAQKQIEQSPKFGSTLSDNDWLLNVKTRIVVPSGVCAADLAFYYQWLQQPDDSRRVDLISWMMPLMPLFEALRLLLMIVRDASKLKMCVTSDKTYQQPLNGTRFDMMRIKVPVDTFLIPDISANKHVIWLRFSAPAFRSKPRYLLAERTQSEVEFELRLCGM